jgi:hypothetical protein
MAKRQQASQMLGMLFLLFSAACNSCGTETEVTDAGTLDIGEVEEGDTETICQIDADCPFGEVCRENRCHPSDPNLHDEGCISNSDCDEGYECAESTGTCIQIHPGVEGPIIETTDCEDGSVRFCGSKIGVCEYGEEQCVNGTWAGECQGGVTPSADICDLLDNDCDGDIDEDFVTGGICSNGFGACKQDGEIVCSPDGAATVCSAVGLDPEGRVELCGNLIDDDCDEETDEGFLLGEPCTDGVGACFRDGVTVCSEDLTATVCTAAAGTPAPTELCGAALDDDCDGAEEEGFETVDDACEAGIGFCRREGLVVCSADQLDVRCTATPGLALPAELCGNNVDDNCNEETDEGFEQLGSACTIGVAPCEVDGFLECSADLSQLECVPTLPTGSTELCNGLDDDNDQCIDEDFDLGVSCVAGDGICQVTGEKICAQDEMGTACDAVPGQPHVNGELCGNGLDDDCDQDTDEGFPEVGMPCEVGDGICERSGAMVCTADGTGTECDATPGIPNIIDICGNGQDDDCNGLVDDGWDVGDPCTVGDGVCERTGVKICQTDGTGTVCSVVPGDPNPLGELCGNGSDDDCNGETDEGFDVGAVCSNGNGTCEEAGNKICTTDGLGTICDAVPSDPNPLGELCDNGDDDDCDGFTDEGFGNLGDNCSAGEGACTAVGSYVCTNDLTGTTCNAVPGAPQPEICDNIDDDCNGTADNGCDDDMDGYCDANMTVSGLPDICPNTLNANLVDCQDEDASIHPNAEELCNDAKDSDCDGDPNNGCDACDPQVDADFDGSNECDDCDETNGSVYPNATEYCDGMDNDCDGSIDEDFDADNDTYTTCGTIVGAGGLSAAFIDCNDGDNTIHPFACELCALGSPDNTVACGANNDQGNLIDEDCDGYADELCLPCDPNDPDGDGFSDCEGDCEPDNSAVSPGLAEVCDGLDTDCNITTVENCEVGDDCWPDDPTSPDVCSAGLICLGEVGGGGNLTGEHTCSSWCNFSEAGLGLGDGCTPEQICGTGITPTANLHGCQVATDFGTLGVGEPCGNDSDCRSGDCYRDQRLPGPPDKYCTDYCGSDAYCGNGTKCMLWGSNFSQCLKVLSIQSLTSGDDCSGTGYCEAGTQACVTLESSAEACTDVCCTNSDCQNNYHCSFRGNESPGPFGGVDGSPVCWPDASNNEGRQAGAACSANTDCASEYCENNLNVCVDICCNDFTCPSGLSCVDHIVTKESGNQTFARVCLNTTPADPLEPK